MRKDGTRRHLLSEHCHVTGAWRGWVCATCNTAISRFHENHYGVLFSKAAKAENPNVQRFLDYLDPDLYEGRGAPPARKWQLEAFMQGRVSCARTRLARGKWSNEVVPDDEHLLSL